MRPRTPWRNPDRPAAPRPDHRLDALPRLGGLLVLTRAVAADSPAPARFTPIIQDLHRRLAADWEHLPKPGFMEGRVGAQLALHATDITGWTRALLLA